MAWYNSNWQYRIKITSDNTKVSASVKGLTYDLSNIVDATFWSNVKSDGSDIRITQSDEVTEVARDVINLDNVSETGQVRFDTSGISTTINEDYYIYFGNASATEPTPSSTFGQYNAYDTNIKAYYPFDNNTGTTAFDRSSNTANGSISGATWVTGKINKGLDFDGTNDKVSIPFGTIPRATYTSKALVKLGTDYTDGSYGSVISDNGYFNSFLGFNDSSFSLNPTGVNTIAAAVRQIGDSSFAVAQTEITPYDISQYLHIGSVLNQANNTIKLYVNGLLEATTTWDGTFFNDNSLNDIGARTSSSNKFDGIIDEPGIWDRAFSDSEMLTFSNNELSNNTFWTTATAEERGVTLSLDLLTINDTFNNVSIINNFNLGIDTLTINDTFQNVTFFNQYNLSLDTGTITNSFNNITLSTGQTLDIDLLTINDTLNNIDFVNKRTLDLQFETITNNFQDITLNNSFTLETDSLNTTYNFNNINFVVFAVELIIDSGSLVYNFEDVSFKINFSQDVFNELTQAKEDIKQIFNEAGETVFYQVNSQTYNKGGQLQSVVTNQYPIKVMWQEGTNFNNQINNIGEYSSGNKTVKLLPQYNLGNGTIITPRLNDYIVTEEGTIWEIVTIKDVRMWNGVLELFSEVVKRNNDWNTN